MAYSKNSDGTYTDLTYTGFPATIDSWVDSQDVTSSMIGIANSYKAAIEAGDVTTANNILTLNPTLKQMMINAETINKIKHAVMALERLFGEDIEEYVTSFTDAAQASATAAATSETAAQTAQAETESARDETIANANAASASATAAARSESNAATSETNAKTSETNAAASESTVTTARDEAVTAAEAAKTSETNAAASEANAADSADAAATSQTIANDAAANATTSKNEAEELVEAFKSLIGTLPEDFQEYIDVMNIVKSYLEYEWTDYTLDCTAWEENTNEAISNKYPICYKLSASDVTEDNSADVVFYSESQEIVTEAGLCTTHYVSDGIVTFYAMQIPSADIQLQLRPVISASNSVN